MSQVGGRGRGSIVVATVCALMGLGVGPAAAFNLPATGGDIAVTKLPALVKGYVPQLMIATRLPTADTRVYYLTQHNYSFGTSAPAVGLFFSYHPRRATTAHAVNPQVLAWDSASLRQIRAIAIAHEKVTKISGTGSVGTFTAGRYHGTVVNEAASTGYGDVTYIWHYSGITYLLGSITHDGHPYLGGLAPTTMIASFRRP